MSSPANKSKSPKPRTRQSYAAPLIPPGRFLHFPSFTTPTFSSNRPQERTPSTCSPNPFQPLSPSPTPTSKQSYALPSSPSTPPLKKPFNIVASSFPLLASPSNQPKYRSSTSQEAQTTPKEGSQYWTPKRFLEFYFMDWTRISTHNRHPLPSQTTHTPKMGISQEWNI